MKLDPIIFFNAAQLIAEDFFDFRDNRATEGFCCRAIETACTDARIKCSPYLDYFEEFCCPEDIYEKAKSEGSSPRGIPWFGHFTTTGAFENRRLLLLFAYWSLK